MYVYFFKPVFQELFFKYTWNNFLHSQVEQCIAFAMNSELSLSIENDASENVLLQNVSIVYQWNFFYMASSVLMIFSMLFVIFLIFSYFRFF